MLEEETLKSEKGKNKTKRKILSLNMNLMKNHAHSMIKRQERTRTTHSI